MALEFVGSSARRVALLLERHVMDDCPLVFPVRRYASRETSHGRLSLRDDTAHAQGLHLRSGGLQAKCDYVHSASPS